MGFVAICIQSAVASKTRRHKSSRPGWADYKSEIDKGKPFIGILGVNGSTTTKHAVVMRGWDNDGKYRDAYFMNPIPWNGTGSNYQSGRWSKLADGTHEMKGYTSTIKVKFIGCLWRMKKK